jgi:hypothetical protein
MCVAGCRPAQTEGTVLNRLHAGPGGALDDTASQQLALHSEVFVMSPRHAVTNVRGQYT